MKKQREFLLHTLVAFISVLLLSQIPVTAQSQQPSPAQKLHGAQIERLMAVLDRMPYTAKGSGPVLYILGYSSCPNCLVIRHEWAGKFRGIQVREIFVPIAADARLQNEAADTAAKRDPALMESYYDHTKQAPPVNSSPQNVAALQKLSEGMGEVNAIFAQIGHLRDGFPTLIFRDRDTPDIFILSGYSRTDTPKYLHQAFGAAVD